MDIRTQCCLKSCHTLEGNILFLLYFQNHSHSRTGPVYLAMKLLRPLECYSMSLSCFCSMFLQLTLAAFESHQTQPTWFHTAKRWVREAHTAEPVLEPSLRGISPESLKFPTAFCDVTLCPEVAPRVTLLYHLFLWLFLASFLRGTALNLPRPLLLFHLKLPGSVKVSSEHCGVLHCIA